MRQPLSEQRARRLSHVATLAVAAVGLGFALRPPQFLQYIVVFSGTGLAATFLFPTLLGVYWPRMNGAGCLAGIVGGFLSFIAQYVAYGTQSFGGFDPFVWSLLVSLVGCIGVSLYTAPSPPALLEKYFGELQ